MTPDYDSKHTRPIKRPRRRRKRTRRKIIRMVLTDSILLAVILCIFALFHHVIPRWGFDLSVLRANKTQSAQSTPVPIAAATPSPTVVEVSPVPAGESLADISVVETTPEPTPDPRSEWQIRFADKFTEEIICTENSYSSPSISITISTFSGMINGYQQTYYVADIYIAQIDNFQTSVANDIFTKCYEEEIISQDAKTNAVISINGDYCGNQYSGYFVRNGEAFYSDRSTNDICVLYRDGTMVTYGPNDYTVDEVSAGDPWQIWKFGPRLLDANGQPLESFNTTWAINAENPRTGIGYYEPGHYCFIVADGRQMGGARGLRMSEFAQIFADLGCVSAYNLDGGGSSVMCFNDALYNRQYGTRKAGDILLIAELPDAALSEEAGDVLSE